MFPLSRLLLSLCMYFQIWFWTSRWVLGSSVRMFVTECMRHYSNSITIRTRRSWATGSQLWGPLLILERSSLSRIPWIKMVMLYFAFWAFGNICLFSIASALYPQLNSVILLWKDTLYLFAWAWLILHILKYACFNLKFGCLAQFRAGQSYSRELAEVLEAVLVCHAILGDWCGMLFPGQLGLETL